LTVGLTRDDRPRGESDSTVGFVVAGDVSVEPCFMLSGCCTFIDIIIITVEGAVLKSPGDTPYVALGDLDEVGPDLGGVGDPLLGWLARQGLKPCVAPWATFEHARVAEGAPAFAWAPVALRALKPPLTREAGELRVLQLCLRPLAALGVVDLSGRAASA
jgi:hypothetical protein